ncbi:MAG: R3H domain-containing nucleic acid-binding protein [Candidatus Obscuribacterales bacterium]|nr:KH domain-containing protein [Cyanobacteria bacterium SZAS LIN-5]RTL35317.1 MAG: KH domain-containing protein [Candidatus Melainabacteria bacterium]
MSPLDFLQENARSYLEKILAILDIEASVNQEEIDETTVCYRIECKPDDARVLIGRNGQTLEALQFIVRQMCKSQQTDQGPFVIDILDYRSRRKRTLEEQAKKGAVAVLNGDTEKFALQPMSPYERRLVHQYLQENFADLASESEAEGADRHIVISFKGMPSGAASEEDGEDDYFEGSSEEA